MVKSTGAQLHAYSIMLRVESGGSRMLMNEKIRFMRQQKGWSQEEMAHRLGMSFNRYGNIEQGQTKLNFAKLKEIAAIFDENVTALLGTEDKNVFHSIGDNTICTQNNFCSLYSDASQCKQNTQIEFNLEKQMIINAQLHIEIKLLKQINTLLQEKRTNKKNE